MTAEAERYVDCHECGAHEWLHWFKDVEERLLRLKLCFTCDHWTGYVNVKERPDVVRVGNIHYIIGGETNEPSRWRGFCGARFRVKFHDGREVVSTNVWCQGHIPDHFKERLPDNAIFIYANQTPKENDHASV